MATAVIERQNVFDTDTVVEEEIESGKTTHIISPGMNAKLFDSLQAFVGEEIEGKDLASEARKRGWELTALCGYTWVPTESGERYPACQECLEVAQRWIAEDGK